MTKIRVEILGEIRGSGRELQIYEIEACERIVIDERVHLHKVQGWNGHTPVEAVLVEHDRNAQFQG